MVEVVDGRTLKLERQTKTISVELLCVSLDRLDDKQRADAAARLKFHTANWGKKVVLEFDPEAPLTTPSGAFRCYVFSPKCANDQLESFFANLAMISSGLVGFEAGSGWPSTYRKEFQNLLHGSLKSSLDSVVELCEQIEVEVDAAVKEGMDSAGGAGMKEGLADMASGATKLRDAEKTYTSQGAKQVAEQFRGQRPTVETATANFKKMASELPDGPLQGHYKELAILNEVLALQFGSVAWAADGVQELHAH